jgi:hypothetical protein
MVGRRRSLISIYGVSLAAILLFATFPLISALGAGAIADAAGCQLDESRTYPCVIGGTDYGETLYALGVLGWLGLITIPYGAAALGLWLIILVVHLIVRFYH